MDETKKKKMRRMMTTMTMMMKKKKKFAHEVMMKPRIQVAKITTTCKRTRSIATGSPLSEVILPRRKSQSPLDDDDDDEGNDDGLATTGMMQIRNDNDNDNGNGNGNGNDNDGDDDDDDDDDDDSPWTMRKDKNMKQSKHNESKHLQRRQMRGQHINAHGHAKTRYPLYDCNGHDNCDNDGSVEMTRFDPLFIYQIMLRSNSKYLDDSEASTPEAYAYDARNSVAASKHPKSSLRPDLTLCHSECKERVPPKYMDKRVGQWRDTFNVLRFNALVSDWNTLPAPARVNLANARCKPLFIRNYSS
ncbi:hypothetical protein RFI_08989 [Reticulomyxa filosa]|uniref:Uncharacterized protein n=1 Tax=Reticulomyxa filosa TaxID=46433 RepID=X6NQE7_RETFI|nr:hypothetical protein RFI_08989 [Reticulomyxa filosa]|eukprot:ETO28143.1 hypothetical protein RFI_08989 [Reticulomyxa filosa]